MEKHGKTIYKRIIWGYPHFRKPPLILFFVRDLSWPRWPLWKPENAAGEPAGNMYKACRCSRWVCTVVECSRCMGKYLYWLVVKNINFIFPIILLVPGKCGRPPIGWKPELSLSSTTMAECFGESPGRGLKASSPVMDVPCCRCVYDVSIVYGCQDACAHYVHICCQQNHSLYRYH
jgi:hypothetical protein